ncbi:hypothetical protein LRM48_000180 [Candidatus Nanosynbacter sp. TM7-008]|uniref:hypothetical protein n=1 Tax=Candidatus Nanosynbacter sp. TM7-008 TaxID=2902632 RepID=UPI001FB62911|nr:hypothetical protein [Candidatus Nanosynbacter sp. TM7-008]MCJ1963833.1 hypothetical protein [Candidatus Nanosynbacter sp. TM7-008]
MEIARGSGVAEIAWEIVESSKYQERLREIVLGIGRAATREFNPESSYRLVDRYVASGVADDILKEKGDTDKAPEYKILELIQRMPYWICAEEKLESYRNGVFYERNNKIREKETVVAFNKVVRDIISEGQYTRKSDLISDVQNAMDCLGYSDEEIENAYKFLDHVINGMRHEIAAEIALRKTKGVRAVYTTDIDDDLAGIDLIVEYKDNYGREHIIGLDIKSTPDSARNANNSDRDEGYHASWSGFDHRRGDFGSYGDNLMPSDEAVKKVRSLYKEELEEISRKEDSRHKKK